jgi:hypothetical protein
MLGAVDPVAKWPSQLTKSQRTQHAREITQAQAATADRPQQPPMPNKPSSLAAVGAPDAEPSWRERTREATESLDAHRRRRRETAKPAQQPAPVPLGSSRRGRNLFVIADDEDGSDEPDPQSTERT